MKILLVEDDESTATLISKALTAHHYLVNTTENGQTGLELTKAYNYDLILLDLMLPGLDGVSLCRKLRSQGAQMPILMLTSKNSSSDRVKGLEAGADDYVVKPFDLSELVARVRALLRRKSTSLNSVLSWGGLHLDLSSRDVTYNQVTVHLTPKEYGLLELFLRNPRRTFDRSALLDSVWDADEFPGERAVTTQIKGLRQKLKAAGMQIDCLETVYGLGYRLKPEPKIEVIDGEDSESPQHLGLGQKVTEAEVANAIESLWHKLAETFTDAFQLLEELSSPASVGTSLNPLLRQQGILVAHRLAGNLGSFGLPRGSDLARQIEQTLQAKTRLSQRDVQQISTWVQALKEVVLQPRRQFTTPPSANAELNDSDGLTARTNRKQAPPAKPIRLLLVDDDVLIGEQIQSVAQSEHFQVTVATT
ncbi:MAG TPA: response regulator, partial [Stenomitos sp.]